MGYLISESQETVLFYSFASSESWLEPGLDGGMFCFGTGLATTQASPEWVSPSDGTGENRSGDAVLRGIGEAETGTESTGTELKTALHDDDSTADGKEDCMADGVVTVTPTSSCCSICFANNHNDASP